MAAKANLVLVPGVLCTKALWEPQMASLADIAEMTVGVHTRHDSIGGIAKAILAAAPQQFALAGLSMGGFVAFEILRQAPQRVTRLALLDTNARSDPPERTEQRRQMMQLAQREGLQRVVDDLLKVFLRPAAQADKRMTDILRRMADNTGIEGFKRQQEAIIRRLDSRPFLRSVRCPTLVLVGSDDLPTPVAMSQEIVAAIPGAKLEIVPDCGHLSTLERPEAVSRALRAWLTQ